jgi:hypothetical protein
MDASMDANNHPTQQSYDPLKQFVDDSTEFIDFLKHIVAAPTLYPPNTRMKDFSGRIILCLSNFVPSDDESISPECVFTLGKGGIPISVEKQWREDNLVALRRILIKY